ncbi:MAG: AAA family ATPase [Euryarchaeota archaeon]|nr:AAA family ATPase [Euryarchaeota archaeon]
MRITKVHITNYRSIKHVEIDMNGMMGLIGPNSAGKSNILKAINLVLGERYPTANSITRKDFFNEDYSNQIEIKIWFDDSFLSYDVRCNGIVYRVHQEEDRGLASELKAIESGTQTERKYNIKNESREKISVIYIPAQRDFEYHITGTSEWSFFGKVIKKLNSYFPDERRAELQSKFDEVKGTLTTDHFSRFESSFIKYFREHAIPNEHDVDINFQAFDPKSYYKTIEIVPKEYGEVKNIDQLGEGMKNIILLSLFRAYAETFPETTIFLFEEPELYLHPQARTDMFSVFKILKDAGSQIIYSTHSQEFIDVEFYDSICVVRKQEERGTYSTYISQIQAEEFVEKWIKETGIKNANDASIRSFLKIVSNAETNRCFFAKIVVLVEGLTETWTLPIYAEKYGLNLAKNNIEIVGVGGKNNLEKFILLLECLRYKYYVIFDGDKTENESADINLKLTKRFFSIGEKFPQTKCGSECTVFEEDFESELKKGISTDPTAYDQLVDDARTTYALRSKNNKEIIARHIAYNTEVPGFINDILSNVKEKL